jgi:hypothetical protein
MTGANKKTLLVIKENNEQVMNTKYKINQSKMQNTRKKNQTEKIMTKK